MVSGSATVSLWVDESVLWLGPASWIVFGPTAVPRVI
jgi:hypothetical protein